MRHQFGHVIPFLADAGRKFRFGDGRIPPICGKVVFSGNTLVQTMKDGNPVYVPYEIHISSEVAEARIPFLLSLSLSLEVLAERWHPF